MLTVEIRSKNRAKKMEIISSCPKNAASRAKWTYSDHIPDDLRRELSAINHPG